MMATEVGPDLFDPATPVRFGSLRKASKMAWTAAHDSWVTTGDIGLEAEAYSCIGVICDGRAGKFDGTVDRTVYEAARHLQLLSEAFVEVSLKFREP